MLSDASKQSSTGRIKARNKFTDPAWPRLAQLSEGRGCPEDQALSEGCLQEGIEPSTGSWLWPLLV